MLIILLSNFNTLQNSKKTNENINAIYNDRLVVATYIFQYTNEFHTVKAIAKETELSNSQKKELINTSIKQIQNIDLLYLKTVLTPKEKNHFYSLLRTCTDIKHESDQSNWFQVNIQTESALFILEKLSQIQIKEGKSKLAHSNKLYAGNTLLGELEIGLLVILSGLALYLLIVKKKKINIKIPESPGMN
ncbi:hypothetical protein SLW70_12725 [Flavobacterium sp. NG2]|uniref:hypothetical protein n=1 Tax=Flavobacterium sp. NG2 TaxID=3097547 RepID=UPI002A7F93F3|nr:hypothetical protein [Flavobacterium sp. NG2]WPR70790.1 hypothetical protein SLW70_12725 [Flavobacterium sp. NG2]